MKPPKMNPPMINLGPSFRCGDYCEVCRRGFSGDVWYTLAGVRGHRDCMIRRADKPTVDEPPTWQTAEEAAMERRGWRE